MGPLNRFSDIFYDVSHHGSKRHTVPFEAAKDVVTYETNGLLSASLLKLLWDSLGIQEQAFLLSICRKLNLLSEFPFKEEPLYFVAPMADQHSRLRRGLTETSGVRESIYVRFSDTILMGTFSYFVCAFVRRSGQFEGSPLPDIFTDYCKVWLQNTEVELQLSNSKTEIQVFFNKNCDFQSDVLDLCESTSIQVSHVFQYGLTIKIQKGTQQKKSVGIVEEKKQEALFDSFLAHEWGTASNGLETHKRVVRLSQRIQEAGFSAWVDEQNLRDNVVKGIISGISASKKIVVFLSPKDT